MSAVKGAVDSLADIVYWWMVAVVAGTIVTMMVSQCLIH
jgi:hypothetical protein